MKARAPGKIVISGAYAVLEGAPAIASAVDRYVVADADAIATTPTPEVAAAFDGEPAPAYDASALFVAGRKLGLGASAAILVASLAARVTRELGVLSDIELAGAVFPSALAAHAQAQGGGSGVDVAASAFGGTIVFRRGGEHSEALAAKLPPELSIEVWWSGRPASTSELIGRVRALRERAPTRYLRHIEAQSAASLEAEVSIRRGDGAAFVRALDAQRLALAALGEAAGAPIVDDAARALGDVASAFGGTALPAGAGGGDVLLFVGPMASPPEFGTLARSLGHERLALSLAARGVHALPSEGP